VVWLRWLQAEAIALTTQVNECNGDSSTVNLAIASRSEVGLVPLAIAWEE
jgi:hypothetical protein